MGTACPAERPEFWKLVYPYQDYTFPISTIYRDLVGWSSDNSG